VVINYKKTVIKHFEQYENELLVMIIKICFTDILLNKEKKLINCKLICFNPILSLTYINDLKIVIFFSRIYYYEQLIN